MTAEMESGWWLQMEELPRLHLKTQTDFCCLYQPGFLEPEAYKLKHNIKLCSIQEKKHLKLAGLERMHTIFNFLFFFTFNAKILIEHLSICLRSYVL